MIYLCIDTELLQLYAFITQIDTSWYRVSYMEIFLLFFFLRYITNLFIRFDFVTRAPGVEEDFFLSRNPRPRPRKTPKVNRFN